jgi:hypothetical protein
MALSFLIDCGTLDDAQSKQRGFWSPVIGIYGAQLWLIIDYFVLRCRTQGIRLSQVIIAEKPG